MRKETHAKKNTRWMKAVLLSFFALLLCSVSGYAQNITVTGKVSDAMGTLPGVSVAIKGTTNGTVTDVDGKYSLNVAKNATLVFSFVGMKSQEVTVNGRKVIDVTMTNDTELLDEVVVVGYGTMKKSDLTGSVTSVNAEEMMKRNPVNLGQGLQGAAAGVSVIRSSGSPDGGFNIRIRGVATVNGSSDPLYVVDGVQVGTSIDFLNPNDVESIEILKDASATAIYGTRGANGVIMITTKNGSKGKAQVNFSANYSLQFNNNKIDVADADLFAKAVRESCRNGSVMTNLAFGEEYIGKLNSIDWQDEMSRTALQQNYNLSASGGTEATQANLSVGYLNNEGVVIESYFKRLTARANITHKVKDFIHVGLNLNYTHAQHHFSGNMRSYAQAIPTMDYVENGVFYSMPIVLPDGSWGHYKQESDGDINKGADNLVAAAKTRTDQISKWDRLVASAFLQLDIAKGLTFKTIGSYNYFTKGYDGYTPYNPRTFGSKDRKDSYSINQNQNSEIALESFVNYDWSNAHHRVSAMAGFSISDTDGVWLNTSASDFPRDNSFNSTS